MGFIHELTHLLVPLPNSFAPTPNSVSTALGYFVGATQTHIPTQVHRTRWSITHPQLTYVPPTHHPNHITYTLPPHHAYNPLLPPQCHYPLGTLRKMRAQGAGQPPQARPSLPWAPAC